MIQVDQVGPFIASGPLTLVMSIVVNRWRRLMQMSLCRFQVVALNSAAARGPHLILRLFFAEGKGGGGGWLVDSRGTGPIERRAGWW